MIIIIMISIGFVENRCRQFERNAKPTADSSSVQPKKMYQKKKEEQSKKSNIVKTSTNHLGPSMKHGKRLHAHPNGAKNDEKKNYHSNMSKFVRMIFYKVKYVYCMYTNKYLKIFRFFCGLSRFGPHVPRDDRRTFCCIVSKYSLILFFNLVLSNFFLLCTFASFWMAIKLTV